MGHHNSSPSFSSRGIIWAARGMVSVFVLVLLLVLPAQSRDIKSHGNGGIALYTYGPARLQVTGPDGSRAGVDLATGEYLEEVEGSDVTVEKVRGRSDGMTLTLTAADPGVYRLDLVGTGTGRVVVDVEVQDAAGGISQSHVLEKIEAGDTLLYTLDFDPTPGRVHRLEKLLE